MRSVLQGLARMSLFCVLVIAGIVGCSRKVTAPNSLQVPEGDQNNQLLMMGWHEQASVWFIVADPGTPDTPSDDHLSVVGHDFWADSAGVRTSTLDASAANQLEALRVGADGNVHPLFDYMIPPTIRLVGHDLDIFDFEDFSPGTSPVYFGRGAVNGVVTNTSPVSNSASELPYANENMVWTPAPKLAPLDSVLEITYVDDPRTVFDVVELSNGTGVLGSGSSFSTERRIRGIPAPFLPGLRPVSAVTFLMPAGAGEPGLRIRLSSRVWPLYFHIRVTGFDGEGRMVNRVNDYLVTHTTDAGTNFDTYEPLGGTVEVLDPYPNFTNPVPVPRVVKRDAAFAILNSFGVAGRPNQVSYLSTSSAPGAPSGSTGDDAVQSALRSAAEPALSEQGLRDNIARFRRVMGLGPQGAATLAPARDREPARRAAIR